MTPFTQKFSQLMEGAAVLKEAEEDFQRACDDYVEKIENENLDPEQDMWPVKYDETKFYELELKDLQRLSFAVADNPFVKADIEKFYPEIHIISGEGKVLATINPSFKNNEKFKASMFCENFRDDKLKINDDRKVNLTLSDFQDKDTMILLTVRSFEP